MISCKPVAQLVFAAVDCNSRSLLPQLGQNKTSGPAIRRPHFVQKFRTALWLAAGIGGGLGGGARARSLSALEAPRYPQ